MEFANAISVSQTLGNAIGFQLAGVPCPVCGSARTLSFAKLFRHAENRYRFIELRNPWKRNWVDEYRSGFLKSFRGKMVELEEWIM